MLRFRYYAALALLVLLVGAQLMLEITGSKIWDCCLKRIFQVVWQDQVLIRLNNNPAWVEPLAGVQCPAPESASSFRNESLENAFPWWGALNLSADAKFIEKQIRLLQSPSNCSTARILDYQIIDCGLGCELHHLGSHLHLALATNRTLVVSGKWIFAPRSCKDASYCCLLRSLGPCRADHYLESEVVSWQQQTSTSRVVRVGSYKSTKPTNGGKVLGQPSFGSFQDRPYLQEIISRRGIIWYRSQLTLMVTQPQAHTIQFVWARIRELFDTTAGTEGLSFIGLHVRQGDKGVENALHSFHEYLPSVQEFARQARTSKVLLSTESKDIIQQADQSSRHSQLKFLYTKGHHRALKAGSGPKRMSQLTELKHHRLHPYTEAMIALTNLYMLALSRAFVGTLSSNYGRIVTELMVARRRHPEEVKYHSLDGNHILGYGR